MIAPNCRFRFKLEFKADRDQLKMVQRTIVVNQFTVADLIKFSVEPRWCNQPWENICSHITCQFYERKNPTHEPRLRVAALTWASLVVWWNHSAPGFPPRRRPTDTCDLGLAVPWPQSPCLTRLPQMALQPVIQTDNMYCTWQVDTTLCPQRTSTFLFFK